MRGTKLYMVWCSMKQRCQNPNNPSYKTYGGRGIEVCAEWYDFARFADWAIEHGYQDGLEIDRANNDHGYSPKNCRWVSPKENRQKRTNVRLSQDKANEIRAWHVSGYKQTEIAKMYGVSPQTVNYIVKGKQWQ
jgi:DNA-binding XRE family transcriptional regulator